MPSDFIIDDDTPADVTHHRQFSRGLIPRDYETIPQGRYATAPAFDLPLIQRSEWSARIKEMKETKSRLSDIRNTGINGQRIPCLDQGRSNYCWGHSAVHAVMLLRARDLQPYVPLSAFAVAAIIKNGRNEGGWGALSLNFITEDGVPSQELWPQGSVDLRRKTPAMWANAAQHKVTEGWVDLQAAVYDRNLTFDQMMTLLLCRVPVVVDFNWWGHSVCAMDPEEIEPGSFGPRILNSWYESPGQEWNGDGTAVLRGSRATPDGAVAPRAVMASAL